MSDSRRVPVRRVPVLALTVALMVVIGGCSSSPSGALVVDEIVAGAAEYEYVIPPGTAERLRSGETVEILPEELNVHVGEVIRVINQDDEGHFVGIFYVGAGETVTQRFASPGEFIGVCTIHPVGQLTLRVVE